MYTYVSSLVLPNTVDAQYMSPDISNVPMNSLFSTYNKIFLTLANTYLSANVYVDLFALEYQLSGYNGTINQWLASIGNMTLPTVQSLPSGSVKYARYSDATRAGYVMEPCKAGYQIPLNYPIDQLPDLKMTRPNYNTDLSLISKYCLATVNGFLHRTDTDGTYAYILQGANTMRKGRQNQVGLLSFLDIGQVSLVPIDVTAVYSDPSDTTRALRDKMYFYLNQPLAGKTVLLSLGGYLVLPQAGIFYQVGNNTFALNTNAIPIPQRYLESRDYIDLSSLGLDVNPVYPGVVNVNQLLSDATLKSYLSLPQSFWIIVDTPGLYTTKQYIKDTGLPGMFIAYEEPISPLFVGYGRMAEYWKTSEDGQWSVTVNDSYLREYSFASTPLQDLVNINSAVIPGTEKTFSKGYTMLIHT